MLGKRSYESWYIECTCDLWERAWQAVTVAGMQRDHDKIFALWSRVTWLCCSEAVSDCPWQLRLCWAEPCGQALGALGGSVSRPRCPLLWRGRDWPPSFVGVTTEGCPALCSCLIPCCSLLGYQVLLLPGYYNTALIAKCCKIDQSGVFFPFPFSASCLNMVSLVPNMATKTWRSTVFLTVKDDLNALMHSICFAFCSLAWSSKCKILEDNIFYWFYLQNQ